MLFQNSVESWFIGGIVYHFTMYLFLFFFFFFLFFFLFWGLIWSRTTHTKPKRYPVPFVSCSLCLFLFIFPVSFPPLHSFCGTLLHEQAGPIPIYLDNNTTELKLSFLLNGPGILFVCVCACVNTGYEFLRTSSLSLLSRDHWSLMIGIILNDDGLWWWMEWNEWNGGCVILQYYTHISCLK